VLVDVDGCERAGGGVGGDGAEESAIVVDETET